MAEPGFALAVVSLIHPTLKLLDATIAVIQDTRHASKDAHNTSIRMCQLKNRYDSLQKILCRQNKFSFIEGRLFDRLPEETQRLVLGMFRELPQLLCEYNTVEKSYYSKLGLGSLQVNQGATSTVAPHAGEILTIKELEIIFDHDVVPPTAPSETSDFKTNAFKSLLWSARGKKRAEKLLAQIEDWLTRIRALLEDVWWPLPFFEHSTNLQILENDGDAQTAGFSEHAGLRKLLVGDAKLPTDMKLNSPQLTIEHFDDACRGLSTYGNESVLVEYTPYALDKDGFLPAVLQRRLSELACLLNQQKDSHFRALHCLGYINTSYPRPEFQLLYRLPSISPKPPVHLLSLYSSKQLLKPSLGARFQLCFQLAQSMSLFHSVDWIHKSFRSTNVLFFPQNIDSEIILDIDLSSPIIAGFEASRLANDFSSGPYNNLLSQNVYRHPDRWGIPNKTFTKYHDIYALGIVLLEIGLWEPAETMGGNDFQLVKQIPHAISNALLRQAERRLGHRCGEKFREVVTRCLKGEFEIMAQRDDKLDSGLQGRFREFVLEKLEELARVV